MSHFFRWIKMRSGPFITAILVVSVAACKTQESPPPISRANSALPAASIVPISPTKSPPSLQSLPAHVVPMQDSKLGSRSITESSSTQGSPVIPVFYSDDNQIDWSRGWVSRNKQCHSKAQCTDATIHSTERPVLKFIHLPSEGCPEGWFQRSELFLEKDGSYEAGCIVMIRGPGWHGQTNVDYFLEGEAAKPFAHR